MGALIQFTCEWTVILLFSCKNVVCWKSNFNIFNLIFRHVQINNDSAIAFYKKFEFNIVETKPAYYKRIEPADAHVLQKNLVKGSGKGSKAVIG